MSTVSEVHTGTVTIGSTSTALVVVADSGLPFRPKHGILVKNIGITPVYHVPGGTTGRGFQLVPGQEHEFRIDDPRNLRFVTDSSGTIAFLAQ